MFSFSRSFPCSLSLSCSQARWELSCSFASDLRCPGICLPLPPPCLCLSKRLCQSLLRPCQTQTMRTLNAWGEWTPEMGITLWLLHLINLCRWQFRWLFIVSLCHCPRGCKDRRKSLSLSSSVICSVMWVKDTLSPDPPLDAPHLLLLPCHWPRPGLLSGKSSVFVDSGCSVSHSWTHDFKTQTRFLCTPSLHPFQLSWPMVLSFASAGKAEYELKGRT
jgi:hypothetical protein